MVIKRETASFGVEQPISAEEQRALRQEKIDRSDEANPPEPKGHPREIAVEDTRPEEEED